MIDVDDQPAGGLGISKLRNQLLADDQALRSVAAAARIGGNGAGGERLEREPRKIRLQAVDEQVELFLLAYLEFLAQEYGSLVERQIRQAAGTPHHGRQSLAAQDG